MALIKLVDVTKKFGKITAVDHLNLSIEDGEYICVLGPTGAGKTTLLRLIAGLLEPDGGEIYIEGKLVNGVPPEERNAAYMFQQYALFPHMNVWQNVSFGPTIKDWQKNEVEKVTLETLQMVRLVERQDALPNELSGGMQQRVALARGIASGARILLLDEPLGALDARLKIEIRSQLRKLVKEHKLTAIHVTHDQEEALMIADRIVVLRNGKIEQIGAPKEIYSKPQSIFVASFVGRANFIEGNLAKVDEVSLIVTQGDFYFRVSDTSKKHGEKVVVAVRYEDTLIGPVEIVGFNNFGGKIESAKFVGGFMEYSIRLQNGIMMTSKILFSDSFKVYDLGEYVLVSFLPEKCYLFSYPEIGLSREIEAI